MKDHPKPLTKQNTIKILEQMDKCEKSIYKIYKINEKYKNYGICIFCKIKIGTKLIPLLLTSYQVIDEEYVINNNGINIEINNELQNIEFFNKTNKYINKEYDLSFIQIKEKEEYKINYLELDNTLYEKDSEALYDKESIYILHYINDEISASFGTINYINQAELICSCYINSNANGSPIFNLSNHKLLGIYKKNSKYFIKGIFFKFIIEQFIIIYYRNKNKYKNTKINLFNIKEDNHKVINNKKDAYYEEFEYIEEERDDIEGNIIVCFDINSTYEENQSKPENNSKEIKENPVRIFDKFFDAHKTVEKKKYKINNSELIYKFFVNLQENTLFQIRIINDLSFFHEICFNADSYIIFINLEKSQTKEKLECLLEYINNNSCPGLIKTYIVGLYNNKIVQECQKDELEILFNENDGLLYEYFQIKINEEQNKHFCFYEYINNKKYNDKVFLTKKIKDYNFLEILEKIINNIYESKYYILIDPFKRKNKDKQIRFEKQEGNYSGVNCNIF